MVHTSETISLVSFLDRTSLSCPYKSCNSLDRLGLLAGTELFYPPTGIESRNGSQHLMSLSTLPYAREIYYAAAYEGRDAPSQLRLRVGRGNRSALRVEQTMS